MADEDTVTIKDLEVLRASIAKDVGEIVADALSLIDKRFDKVESDVSDLKDTTGRIENKLNATVARMDDHGDKIEEFQKKLA